jgi:hypothetical protein
MHGSSAILYSLPPTRIDVTVVDQRRLGTGLEGDHPFLMVLLIHTTCVLLLVSSSRHRLASASQE